MKPYANPLIANPMRKSKFESGRPNRREGPCMNIERPRTMKAIKINNLLGDFSAALLTRMHPMKQVVKGKAKMSPFQNSSIFFSFLSTSVKNDD